MLTVGKQTILWLNMIYVLSLWMCNQHSLLNNCAHCMLTEFWSNTLVTLSELWNSFLACSVDHRPIVQWYNHNCTFMVPCLYLSQGWENLTTNLYVHLNILHWIICWCESLFQDKVMSLWFLHTSTLYQLQWKNDFCKNITALNSLWFLIKLMKFFFKRKMYLWLFNI